MEKIKFYTTADGSLGLYNEDVDDVYHSKFGAKEEAIEKFVEPSGLRELLKTKDEIKILDICYGIGYNTKCSIELMLDFAPQKTLIIDAIENDKILAELSPFLNNTSFDVNKIIYNALNCPKPLIDENITPFLQKEMIEKNKTDFNKNVNLNFYFEDGRRAILKLNKKYDIIYLDAFTPLKCPELWSYDFFLKLKDLIFEEGIFLTYSNSAQVRHALSDAGFFIGKNLIGEKSFGTVASLNQNLIKTPLNKEEMGLLNTKAGIYFRDEKLNLTRDEMIKNRENEISKSNLISSSAYKKNYS